MAPFDLDTFISNLATGSFLVPMTGHPFLTLCLGSIGMACVITESCYKGVFFTKELWGNDHTFVKFHG